MVYRQTLYDFPTLCKAYRKYSKKRADDSKYWFPIGDERERLIIINLAKQMIIQNESTKTH